MNTGSRDPHKRSRRARKLKSKVESCVTFSAFRRLVRRTCRILSGENETGKRRDKHRGFAVTKGFLLNLRNLVAVEAIHCCQRAASLQRLSSRTNLGEAAVQAADAEDRQTTDPAVHNLCEAVAGDTPETRRSAAGKFYGLDWWSTVVPIDTSISTCKDNVRRDSEQPVEYKLARYRSTEPERTQNIQSKDDDVSFTLAWDPFGDDE